MTPRDSLAAGAVEALAEIERGADKIAVRARIIGGLGLHATRASEIALEEIEPLARHISKLAALAAVKGEKL